FSSWETVKNGLLFLIYTNDLAAIINYVALPILFADDNYINSEIHSMNTRSKHYLYVSTSNQTCFQIGISP
ncbi:hypothetical protein C0J52_24695, partial [Blattella germanica]